MKRLVALLTAILCSLSLTVSASASMAVLCVEKNGNSVIEYSFNARCADAGFQAPQGQLSQTNVHCTDCVDKSLDASVSSVSPRVTDKVVLAQVATYVAALLDCSFDTTASVLAFEFRQPHPPMRSAYLGQRPTIVIQQ